MTTTASTSQPLIICKETVEHALSYLRSPTSTGVHSVTRCLEILCMENTVVEVLCTGNPVVDLNHSPEHDTGQPFIYLCDYTASSLRKAAEYVDSWSIQRTHSDSRSTLDYTLPYHNSRHTAFVLAHTCRQLLNLEPDVLHAMQAKQFVDSLLLSAVIHDYAYGEYQRRGFSTGRYGTWLPEQVAFVLSYHLIPEHLRSIVYPLVLITNLVVRDLYQNGEAGYSEPCVRHMYYHINTFSGSSENRGNITPSGEYLLDIALPIISNADLCESVFTSVNSYIEQTRLVFEETPHNGTKTPTEAQRDFVISLKGPLGGERAKQEKAAYDLIKDYVTQLAEADKTPHERQGDHRHDAGE